MSRTIRTTTITATTAPVIGGRGVADRMDAGRRIHWL